MASVENPIGLNSEQHRAFSESVFSRTVGIVNLQRVQRKTPSGQMLSIEEMGTGSACQWRDRKLILTAKHVLENAGISDLRFFLRPTGSVDWGARSGPPTLSGSTVLDVKDIVRSRAEDLAVLILEPEPAERSGLLFCDLPTNLKPVPSGSGVTLLIGYPGDLTFPVAATRQEDGVTNYMCAVMPSACWGSIISEAPRYFPSSYDPGRHFLIRFDPQEEGSMPHGYSGTGVWYQSPFKRQLWAADPVLAGVQTAWHRPSNLMIAVRSEIVREFLEQCVG